MSKEVMKLALEALGWTEAWRPQGLREEAITALREALVEQPAPVQQEPVAFVKGRGWRDGKLEVIPAKMNQTFEIDQPLYTAPPAQQEPYCYTYTENGEEYFAPPKAYVPDDATPLYTSPPAQRTWVGLTNDEVNNLAAGCHLGNSVQDAIYKAAAKLKEKNT